LTCEDGVQLVSLLANQPVDNKLKWWSLD